MSTKVDRVGSPLVLLGTEPRGTSLAVTETCRFRNREMSNDYFDRPTRPFGRSLYGMLVPLPMSCFALALLTDLAYWKTDSVLWETFSVWLLALGLIVAGLAVLGGVVDLVRSRNVRGLEQSLPTVVLQLVAIGLALVNVLVHSRDGYTAVVPEGLILSALTVLALLVGAVLDRPSAGLINARRIG